MVVACDGMCAFVSRLFLLSNPGKYHEFGCLGWSMEGGWGIMNIMILRGGIFGCLTVLFCFFLVWVGLDVGYCCFSFDDCHAFSFRCLM